MPQQPNTDEDQPWGEDQSHAVWPDDDGTWKDPGGKDAVLPSDAEKDAMLDYVDGPMRPEGEGQVEESTPKVDLESTPNPQSFAKTLKQKHQ